MNVHEALQALEAKKKARLEKKGKVVTTNSQLSLFWASRVQLTTGEHVKQVTVKEAAQLKLLAKRLGSETKQVIDYALTNWSQFGHTARLESGQSHFPVNPHIGFLLAHYHVVLNMMAPKVKQMVEVKPKVVKTVLPPKKAEDMPTVEEILADLKEFS